MIRRLGYYAICICFMIIMLLSGCKKEPVKIGLVGNLGDTGSDLSVNTMYGAMLAVEAVNDAGGIKGRQVQLVVKNDMNDPKRAVEVDNELIEEGALGIIGHSLSSMGVEAVPFINEKGIVMVSPTMSSDMYANKKDWLFVVTPSTVFQSIRISEALFEHGHDNIGILYQEENKAYSYQMVSDLKGVFEEVGNIVFEKAFESSKEGGYEEAVSNIENEKITALVIMGSNYDIASLAQVFDSKGMTMDVYMPTWGMGEVLLDNAGGKAEGYYAVGAFDHTSQVPSYLEFKERYRSKYGEEPTFSSLYGYEAAMLLLDSIIASDDFDRKKIKEVLDSTESYQGLQERIILNENGDSIRTMYLMQVSGDDFIRID